MPIEKLKVALTASAFAVMTMTAAPAYAGPSDDECAIWLCLPSAFIVGECDPAFGAMIKRITSFPPKPPLPLLHQCLRGPDGSVTGTNGSFTHIESEYEPCQAGFTVISQGLLDDEEGFRDPGKSNERVCSNLRTGERYTVYRGQNRHYVTVTIDGVTYDTFSFTENGR